RFSISTSTKDRRTTRPRACGTMGFSIRWRRGRRSRSACRRRSMRGFRRRGSEFSECEPRKHEMAYEYLLTKREHSVEYLTLNRPDVRNAFNEEVIAELTRWASATSETAQMTKLRVVVLAGAGKSF